MTKKLTITIFIIGLLSSCLLSLVSCQSNTTDKSDDRSANLLPDSLWKKIVIDTATVSNVTYAIKFNGIIDYNTDKVVNIFPLVSGNVQDVKAVLGDYVHEGEILGMVQSPEIANYNAALITAESNVCLNQKLLDQQKDLYKSGLASQIDVTNAEVSYEQAVAAKIAAEKIMSINGNNKNGVFYIKSPVNGFIVQKNITNGMAVRTDNGGNMFTISDLKDVWVQANVYEGNIGSVHEGDTVDVSTISYPNKIFRGKIDKLMNALDPTSRAMKMKVVLSNPGYLLKPQMFATISTNNKLGTKAVTISSADLIFDHSQYYVVVLTGKNNVQLRPVELLSISGGRAYIKSGLSKGERIIGSQTLLIYGTLNS